MNIVAQFGLASAAAACACALLAMHLGANANAHNTSLAANVPPSVQHWPDADPYADSPEGYQPDDGAPDDRVTLDDPEPLSPSLPQQLLAKIPGLDRLFTNRSLAKDEDGRLIRAQPKVIQQREAETDLFSPGYDRPTGLP